MIRNFLSFFQVESIPCVLIAVCNTSLQTISLLYTCLQQSSKAATSFVKFKNNSPLLLFSIICFMKPLGSTTTLSTAGALDLTIDETANGILDFLTFLFSCNSPSGFLATLSWRFLKQGNIYFIMTIRRDIKL